MALFTDDWFLLPQLPKLTCICKPELCLEVFQSERQPLFQGSFLLESAAAKRGGRDEVPFTRNKQAYTYASACLTNQA